jgi:hypothetical protein
MNVITIQISYPSKMEEFIQEKITSNELKQIYSAEYQNACNSLIEGKKSQVEEFHKEITNKTDEVIFIMDVKPFKLTY